MIKKSIRKNYVFNLSYQILLVITPLITTPYISRVLGPEGIGTYSFMDSIVSYFVLFATMGMTLFGQREISYYQDDKEKRTEVFWNTKVLSLITTIISLIIYLFVIFNESNHILYIIFAMNIISVAVDVSWLFQGLEEFGKIVFRNLIFKILGIIFIFVFVKTSNDLIVYIFGTCIFILLGNVSLWFYLPKYISKPNLLKIKPFMNIKIIVSLFIPTIAIQVYTVLDKTMIGIITQNAFENGYYDQAIKIVKIILILVTSLGMVMIPRIGYHFNKKEIEIVKEYMYRGYRYVWFLGIPICLGLIGISSNFVPWFFGDGYEKVIVLLMILSLLVLAIGINNVTGMQYLIPTKRQKTFTFTVIIGAITNFVLNLILIPNLLAVGAAIASVAAESVIAISQIYIVRKELSPKKIITSSYKYLQAGLVMMIFLSIESYFLNSGIINTLLMIISSGCIYFITLYVLKDDFFIDNLRVFISKIKSKKS